MNNLHDVWSKRFVHYISEVQKYMQYVFTGHIGVVFVFMIGAIGYQYSEWLKVVEDNFPVEWIVASVVGLVVALSRPTTLLREPDQVYLLPLESHMPLYTAKALRFTFWSQLLVVVVPYIVSIPLLKAVTELTTAEIWTGIVVAIALKYLNVQLEFAYRYHERGAGVWIDRGWRFLASLLTMLAVLQGQLLFALLGLIVLVIVWQWMAKKMASEPLPYEHFVKLEQNRMMGFYRFANYFTDVPHLRGTIRSRAWLNGFYKMVGYGKDNTQQYLVFRTFVRTDDHFYLWLRLTVISAIVAMFVDIVFVTWVVAGALAFATTIQLKSALLASNEFRMDMLFPVQEGLRALAVRKLLRVLVVVQAVIVTACSIGQPLFYIAPIVIVVVGEVTERMTLK